MTPVRRLAEAQGAFEASKDPTYRRRLAPGICGVQIEFTDKDGQLWSRPCGAPLRGTEERSGTNVHIEVLCDQGHGEHRWGYADVSVPDYSKADPDGAQAQGWVHA